MVKERLPNLTGSQDDAELQNCIAYADAIIDNALQNYTSTPLSSPPQLIRDLSADLAAGIFRQRRAPPNEPTPLLESAKKILQDYVAEKYVHTYNSADKRFRKVDRLDDV